jgi:hypothetical protein
MGCLAKLDKRAALEASRPRRATEPHVPHRDPAVVGEADLPVAEARVGFRSGSCGTVHPRWRPSLTVTAFRSQFRFPTPGHPVCREWEANHRTASI